MLMCIHLIILNVYTCYYLLDADAYSAFVTAAKVDVEERASRPPFSIKEALKPMMVDPTGMGTVLAAGFAGTPSYHGK